MRSGELAGSRLRLPGTTNVRDLVGYPAGSGQVIGPGRLLRGEVITTVAAEPPGGPGGPGDDAPFRLLGLRTIIDLRSEYETARTASGWPAASGAHRVELLPIADGGEGSDTNYMRQLLDGTLAQFGLDQMQELYRTILERRAATLASAVSLIADPDNLPVLVHCAVGKDRTGIVIALVLDLLGTSRDLIVEDYALTGHLRPDRVEAFAPMLRAAGVEPTAVRILFESPPAVMWSVFDWLDRHGGTAHYLQTMGGAAPDLVARLRQALLVTV